MSDSPDINNLTVGKGILYFTPTGGVERDMGECTTFETTPGGDTLDYFSNRSGIKKKVRSVVTSASLALRIVASEATAENLAMQLGGDDPTSGGAGVKTGGTFNPISEEWMEIEINGEALATEHTDGTSDFGTVTVTDQAA